MFVDVCWKTSSLFVCVHSISLLLSAVLVCDFWHSAGDGHPHLTHKENLVSREQQDYTESDSSETLTVEVKFSFIAQEIMH